MGDPDLWKNDLVFLTSPQFRTLGPAIQRSSCTSIEPAEEPTEMAVHFAGLRFGRGDFRMSR